MKTDKLLLPDLAAGLLVGLLLTLDSASVGVLIFSGPLSAYRSFGISNVLLSSTLMSLVVALGSAFPVALATPATNAAAILAPIALAIALQLQQQQAEAAILPTVWMLLFLSSLLTGGCLFFMGQLRLSRFIRFIPYPVMGGFLAGAGWLTFRGAIAVITGEQSSLETALASGQIPVQLLPAFLLAILLVLARQRYKKFWVLPVCILLAIGVTYGGFWLTGTSIAQARLSHWLLQPLSEATLSYLNHPFNFKQVNWEVLLPQTRGLVSVVVLVPIMTLLNATAIEIFFQQDADLDQQLQVNGLGNLLIGLWGSTISQLSPSNTFIARQMGARSHWTGLIATLFCGGILGFGGQSLGYIPLFVVAGLNLYFGLELLIEWLYRAWFRLSHFDYALVVMILAIVALFGFLEGVGLGILIACLLFVINYSRLNVIRHAHSGKELQSNVQRSSPSQTYLLKRGNLLQVFKLQGYIFFGTADFLLNQVRQRMANQDKESLNFLILDLRLVTGIDSSAVLGLIKIKQLCHKYQCILILTTLPDPIRKQLSPLFKPDKIEIEAEAQVRNFPDFDRGLEWCEEQILNQEFQGQANLPSLSEQLMEVFPQPEQVQAFICQLEQLTLKPGQYLFHQGDPSDGLYFVESGQVTVLLEYGLNQNRRLRTFKGGTVVGEMGLYEQSPRSASVVVDQPSQFYYLSKSAFEKMKSETPDLAAAFHEFMVRLLSARLRHREKELQTFL